MTRWMWRAAGAVLVVGVALGIAVGLSDYLARRGRVSPGAARPADPVIQNVMHTAYGGPALLHAAIGRGLAGAEPNWDEVRKAADELTRLAALLETGNPPRGSRESWQEQTAAHREAVRSLARAARDGDRDRARAAHRGLQTGCMKCHSVHR